MFSFLAQFSPSELEPGQPDEIILVYVGKD